MKNITLSAQEEAIERGRRFAANRHKSLNDLFRKWLDELPNEQPTQSERAQQLYELWEKTSYFRLGKKPTREEMNER